MTLIACCSGTVDAGIPTGAEGIIAGHKAYAANPAQPTGNILVIGTDVFGFTVQNPRLIADRFAAEGYLCVAPDMFKGTEPPADLMDTIFAMNSKDATFVQTVTVVFRMLRYFPAFLFRNNENSGIEIIKSFIADLKVSRRGNKWGGAIGIRLAQQPDIVDVVTATHPGGSLQFPHDAELIVKPIYFALAEIDQRIKEADCDSIKLALTQKNFEFEVEWFEGVQHGFAIRGSKNDEMCLRKERRRWKVLLFLNAFLDNITFFNAKNSKASL
ncbi:hypothetical protein HK100_009908 [Physocladia obscura]|uniref:Dienelactone hydrolase domain-containing protein n=1 Tax=Physocladia obscura TaxID=109957 RepID=A0AAD5T5K1_9FUNG|nr:hypothetical protein HK100_009908 [Physocladia obscura]